MFLHDLLSPKKKIPNESKLGIERCEKFLGWLESPTVVTRREMASQADSIKGHLISQQQDAAMISVQSDLRACGYIPETITEDHCWMGLGAARIF